jgi:hypothetical protein
MLETRFDRAIPLAIFVLSANDSHATPLIGLLLACHTTYRLFTRMPHTIKAIQNPQPRYLAGTCLALLGRNCNTGDAGASTSTSSSPTLLSCPPVPSKPSKSELCKSDKSDKFDSRSCAFALALACSTKGASSLSNSESCSLLLLDIS